MGSPITFTAIAIAAALAVALPGDVDARGKSGARSGGARSGAHHHHHRHHGSFHSAFFFWSPWWYPGAYYYPYPSPPAVRYVEPAGPVYIEQFVGEPTPGTTEVIWCRNRGAYYPDATDCPGGWARVVE